ncbi:hypothetical protein AGMMS49921_05770 [Endomicrobiia bacterium]|nr:hypothetical protein AGMMS49921_05770 [Endomicrobiia bacterium]
MCSHCGSKRYYKNDTGIDNKDMLSRLQEAYKGGVHSADVKNKAIYYPYVNKVECRRRILSVAALVVLGWTRKASEKIKLLKKEESKGKIDEIELDEIFNVKKKSIGCSYRLLIVGDKSLLLHMK